MSVIERVRDLIEPLIIETGLELFDVEQAGVVLRITVDSPEGVDLARLAAATRAVSRALDEHDPVPGGYTLEVTSPGLERKLRTPDHYRRSIGTEVSIKLMPGNEERRVRGLLAGADDDAAVVTVEGSDRRIPYAQISKATTVFEWGPEPRPGAKESKKQPGGGKVSEKKSSAGASEPPDGTDRPSVGPDRKATA